MIELTVHTQPMMSGRIDVKCPNCKQRTAHYPSLTLVKIERCVQCNFPLAEAPKLYKNETFKFDWHFFRKSNLSASTESP